MVELKLTPEFAHLHLEKIDDFKPIFRLSLDGSALSTCEFYIQTGFDSIVINIDSRIINQVINKNVFYIHYQYNASPYMYVSNRSSYRTDKPIKTVAQFKQSKFDQIKGRKNVAKPSKFFSKE